MKLLAPVTQNSDLWSALHNIITFSVCCSDSPSVWYICKNTGTVRVDEKHCLVWSRREHIYQTPAHKHLDSNWTRESSVIHLIHRIEMWNYWVLFLKCIRNHPLFPTPPHTHHTFLIFQILYIGWMQPSDLSVPSCLLPTPHANVYLNNDQTLQKSNFHVIIQNYVDKKA